MKKDKREMSVGKTVIFVATEPGAAFALSVLNSVKNSARIRDSWTGQSTNYRQAGGIGLLPDIDSLVHDFADRQDAKWTYKELGGEG